MVNLNIDGCKKTYDLKNNTDGIRLSDIAKDFENNYSGYISLAVVNNDVQELNTYIKEDSDIKFLDTKNPDGLRVYTRTLNLVFIMACKCLFKDSRVVIEHSLSNGVYCEIYLGRDITEEDISKIKDKMDKIIAKDYDINKNIYTKKEAI